MLPFTCEAWQAWKGCISFMEHGRLAPGWAGTPSEILGDYCTLAIPFHFATN